MTRLDSAAKRAKLAAAAGIEGPVDLDNPGDAYIRAEIDSNRKKERWLVVYGLLSLCLVAILIIIRLIFF